VNVLDLFSGIGGFSLGLESTGFFKTIAFVEKDKFCQKVLQKNFPNIPIEDEVRNVKGERYKADVITGGFPCQPFSVAGKRRGTEDDRFLWDETIRIVSEQKPKWFIGENVDGIINIQDGMVFRQIHDDLESEGFEVQSLVIPASGVGAWHQRKRVWIIAHSNNDQFKKIKKSDGEKKEIQKKHRQKYSSSRQFMGTNKRLSKSFKRNKDVSNSNNIRSVRVQEPKKEIIGGSKATSNSSSSYNVSNTKKFGMERLWKVWQQKPEIYGKEKISLWSSKNKEQSWWQTQSEFCGVPNGVSTELDKDRANRIKSLGNSIVPQIAREIGKAIMEAELG